MKRLLTIIVAGLMLIPAVSAFAAVNDTPHDYLNSADGYGRCQVCHVPHAANSLVGKRLWQEPTLGALAGDVGTWNTAVVAQLCGLTCHGGPAAPKITSQNTDLAAPHVVNSVYAATSHGRSMTTLGAGAANIRDTAADAANRPYMTTNIDCTSCHNPHDATVRPFLRVDAAGAQTSISEVCGDCHNRYNQQVEDNTVADAVHNALATAGGRSMHPVDVTYEDKAVNNSSADANAATQFKDPVGLKTNVNALDGSNNPWTLGPKFADADDSDGISHAALSGPSAAFFVG